MQQPKIKRVYIRYQDWEDWRHGMWRKVDNEEEWLNKAVEFTGNHTLYGKWMREAIKRWPLTMLHNLTNTSVNRRAFIGHCAVCLAIGCPEYIVRMAWKRLTEEQRILADKEAEETYQKWKSEYLNTLKLGNNGVIRRAFQMKLL